MKTNSTVSPAIHFVTYSRQHLRENELTETKISKAETHGIGILIFSNISEGTAFLFQGVTENDFNFKLYKFKIWEILYH